MNEADTPSEKLVVALDVDDEAKALSLADALSITGISRFKVGLELFHVAGPAVVARLTERGYRVFLDLKYHDIVNTVERTVRQAVRFGAWMINVHALGGRQMMQAAALAASEAASALGTKPPLLIGVTVLTNLNSAVLSADFGLAVDVDTLTLRLARLANGAGLEGVVCSVREVEKIKESCGPRFLTVTPGIRPSGSQLGDQQRVATPAAALAAGSDYLVVGRPITRAKDPVRAARAIIAELEGNRPSGGAAS